MTTLSGKRVLVTGAAGFIGSHLVEALVAQGADVRALVHYNARNDWGNLELIPQDVKAEVDVRLGDVQDPFGVAAMVSDREVVFHLAALIGIPYSYVHPASYVNVNVTGTLNVLEAARRFGIERLVHTSTSETYGTAQTVPIAETHPLVGQSPYSASKIGADMLAESYARSFDVPVVTLRPFNTFGPRQSLRAVIPTIAAQAILGGAVKLGSLHPVRDFTYVTDTARAFIAAAGAPAEANGRTFNAGNGRSITIGEVAERILAIVGGGAYLDAELQERKRPDRSEVGELIADATLLRELTGWAPQVSLDEGLRHVVDFIRSRSDLKPHLYTI